MSNWFACAFAAVAAAVPTAVAANPETEPSLGSVRAATSRFQDVKVALAEGYVRDPDDVCVTADMVGLPASDGAMGVHYIRMDLLGITGPPNPRVNGVGTHTDFLKPGVLLYEPQADGSLVLVAVENLVFVESWNKAGNTRLPAYQNVAYNLMADNPATPVDEAHMFEPHYDRHVWLYRTNPRGIFTQFNPAVSCAHHKGAKHHPPVAGSMAQ